MTLEQTLRMKRELVPPWQSKRSSAVQFPAVWLICWMIQDDTAVSLLVVELWLLPRHSHGFGERRGGQARTVREGRSDVHELLQTKGKVDDSVPKSHAI